MNGGDQKAIERCQQYQRDECENGRGEDVENLFVQVIFAEVGLIRIDVVYLKMYNINSIHYDSCQTFIVTKIDVARNQWKLIPFIK